MRIAIGIDTGGTYTDAVIYDFQNKMILATAKALTTKEELSVGILEALDALPPEYLQKAELISLSTTLATNACVEDKGGSAKLVFLGGDRGIIDAYGPEYGLPPAKDMLILDCYTTFSGQIERAVDWGAFAASIEGELGELDGIGVIELNGMKNSGIQERQAKRLIKEKLDTPVVCAHELFKELNCLQRGSSALLNARLIPVIREFLAAIKTAMQKRQIEANLVIVRSDGSLMSESSADTRPVETLLCGPAASVIGSIYLTGGTDTVVVDMGGTTTDIALVQDGSPVQAVNGVAIGNWRTFVNGFYVKTFGLGGDTAIHYSHNQLFLEKYRVVPLCVAAVKYPQIITNLNSLLVQSRRHTRYLHEHYILVKDISGSPRYSDDEKAFCAALESGPKIFREAAVGMPGRDVYNLDVSRLLSEGIVQVCGLTPTDIMHIKGDFNRFSVEASLLGAEFVAANLGLEIDELCDKVYDEIKRKLYLNIVMALLESQDSDFRDKGLTQETERFISKSYEMAKSGLTGQGGGAVSAAGGGGTGGTGGGGGAQHGGQPLTITSRFSTSLTLTGVGAPIAIFLDDVAQMLGTKAVIPEHYEVANALGTVVSNICATNVIQIKPNFVDGGASGFIAFGNTEARLFQSLGDAEDFATAEARAGALEQAEKRGAQGEVTVTSRLQRQEGQARDCLIYLGTEVTAQAVGAVGLEPLAEPAGGPGQ